MFCAIQCRPVTLYTDSDGEYYDDPMPGHQPTLWCVYGIYNNNIPRGTQLLEGFETHDDAIRYANELAGRNGWPTLKGE